MRLTTLSTEPNRHTLNPIKLLTQVNRPAGVTGFVDSERAFNGLDQYTSVLVLTRSLTGDSRHVCQISIRPRAEPCLVLSK